MPSKEPILRPCPGDCGRFTKEHEPTCGDPECSQKFFWLLAKHRDKNGLTIEERIKQRVKNEKRVARKREKKPRREAPNTLGQLIAFKEPKPEPAA